MFFIVVKYICCLQQIGIANVIIYVIHMTSYDKNVAFSCLLRSSTHISRIGLFYSWGIKKDFVFLQN